MPSQRHGSVSRPRSLPLVLLCVVQGCERFAYLAMLPLFVLFAQAQQALTTPTALLVLALFQALSYLGGLPAGWLADRKLGAWGAALLGSVLLGGGYGGLALSPRTLLWPTLAMMGMGHSLFKPGIHVLIANVTGGEERARERGFLWHYLSVNLGHAAGALFGEWAYSRHGWPSLFAGAAAVIAAGAGLLAVGSPWLRSSAGEGQLAVAPSAPVSPAKSMRAVWLLCGVAVIFWLTAQQAGGTLTLFASANSTQAATVLGRVITVGPGHFASLHGLFVLALLPLVLALQSRKRANTATTIDKVIWGYVATSAAFAVMAAAGLRGGDLGRVSETWLVGCYALLSVGEVFLAPLGVALVTRLAPTYKAGQAVGLWFAGCALGNGLAGALGLVWDRWSHHRYFAALALLSLGAGAALLPRRRQLNWLTALNTSASSRPVLDERKDTMTPTPELNTNRADLIPSSPSLGTYLVRPALAILAIGLPCVLTATRGLPLPVRGVCAIVGGLTMLLCGSYLFGQAFTHPARRMTAPQG
ncbi:MAG: MFS transporter [Polyangia bacterium]